MHKNFAKIDSENRVKSIHIVDHADCQDENGDISNAVGIAYLTKVLGLWMKQRGNGILR